MNPQDSQPTMAPETSPVPASTTPEPHHSLPAIDQLMVHAWERFKERFWPLVITSTLPLITGLVLGLIIVFVAITTGFGPYFQDMPVASQLPDISPWLFVIGALGGLVLVVVSAWSNLALYTIASSPEKLSVKNALLQTRYTIFQFFIVALLLIIIVGGSAVFFFIPSIIFSVFFTFWIFTFVVEGEKGMNALLKSREYVRGVWWRTLGYIAMLAVISILFSIVVALFERIFASLAGLLRLAFQMMFPAFTAVYLACLFSRYQEFKKGMVFAPTKKQKALYLIVGVLGIVFVLALAIGLSVLVSTNPYLPNI